MDKFKEVIFYDLKDSVAKELSIMTEGAQLAIEVQELVEKRRAILEQLDETTQKEIGTKVVISSGFFDKTIKIFDKKMKGLSEDDPRWKSLNKKRSLIKDLSWNKFRLDGKYLNFLHYKIDNLGDPGTGRYRHLAINLTHREHKSRNKDEGEEISLKSLTLEDASKSVESYLEPNKPFYIPIINKAAYQANEDNFNLLAAAEIYLRRNTSIIGTDYVKKQILELKKKAPDFCESTEAKKIIKRVDELIIQNTVRPYVSECNKIQLDLDSYIFARKSFLEKIGLKSKRTEDQKYDIIEGVIKDIDNFKKDMNNAESEEEIQELVKDFTTKISRAKGKLYKEHVKKAPSRYRRDKPRAIKSLEALEMLEGPKTLKKVRPATPKASL